ncbi:MAG: hypothetical protein WAR41_12480, partial [Azonexus sp.]
RRYCDPAPVKERIGKTALAIGALAPIANGIKRQHGKAHTKDSLERSIPRRIEDDDAHRDVLRNQGGSGVGRQNDGNGHRHCFAGYCNFSRPARASLAPWRQEQSYGARKAGCLTAFSAALGALSQAKK